MIACITFGKFLYKSYDEISIFFNIKIKTIYHSIKWNMHKCAQD